MTYHGQWYPPVDRILEQVFFPTKSDGVLVECGAADGIDLSCGKFFDDRGWSCYNLEPAPERFADLVRNRTSGRSCNLNLALSDRDGEVTVNRGPTADASLTIPCRTWKTLVESIGLAAVDLLCLDVEGHELQVVRGMHGCDVLPTVICAEYTWPQVGLRPLEAFLAPLGYHLWFVSWNNAYLSREPRPSGPFFGETREYGPGELV